MLETTYVLFQQADTRPHQFLYFLVQPNFTLLLHLLSSTLMKIRHAGTVRGSFAQAIIPQHIAIVNNLTIARVLLSMI
jgi:hypothetical protein